MTAPSRNSYPIALAVANEHDDTAILHIPERPEYATLLPAWLADYNLSAPDHTNSIVIPGPLALEKAEQYAGVLNKRVDDLLSGTTGRTVKLPPRPIIQLPAWPSIVFYPIKIDLRWITRRRILWTIAIALVLYALYWLVIGIAYLQANEHTSAGAIVPEHNWTVNADDQLTIHVSTDRQYTIRNFRKQGIVWPPDCRLNEKATGEAILFCGDGAAAVPVVSLPEIRSHHVGDSLSGKTMFYPGTITDIPDDELHDR